MERTTLEVIAPSVEEAVSRGVEQLGVPRELVDVDILDEGSKGFLGLGGRQVRVRLTLKSTEASLQAKPAPQAVSTPVATLGDSLLDFCVQTTSELLAKMKIKARVEAKYGEADAEGEVPVLIDIHGDDLSVLLVAALKR
jgi:spoIIIJ-associated protein